MSSQARSRGDRRKQETRARILEAAVELFGEVGFEATKVADVCERADVARQTFFNHFPTKSDLLAELYRRGGDFMSATLDSAYERGATTRERLALFFADAIEATIEVGPLEPRSGRARRARATRTRTAPSRRSDRRRCSRASCGAASPPATSRAATRPRCSPRSCRARSARCSSTGPSASGFDPLRRAADLAALVADALEVRPDER